MTAQRVKENKAVFTELSIGFLKFEDRAQGSQTKQTKDRHEQFYRAVVYGLKTQIDATKIVYFYEIGKTASLE